MKTIIIIKYGVDTYKNVRKLRSTKERGDKLSWAVDFSLLIGLGTSRDRLCLAIGELENRFEEHNRIAQHGKAYSLS